MQFKRYAYAGMILAVIANVAAAQSTNPQPARPPAAAPASQPTTQPTPRRPRPHWPEVTDMLDSRVPHVAFHDAPLSDVMRWVQDYTGAVVLVRWGVLEDVGVARDEPITLELEDRPLWLVLWAIMNEIESVAHERMAYEATTESILISTHRDLSRRMITKAYEVTVESLDVPDFAYNPSGGARPQEGTVVRTVLDRSGTQDASGGGLPRPRATARGVVKKAERMQEITDLILMSVEPESWAANGLGGRGTVFPYKNRLVVYNSLYVHQIIGGLMRAAEAASASTPEPVRPDDQRTENEAE